MVRAIVFVWATFAFAVAAQAQGGAGSDQDQIRNLMSRYVYALDGKDAESYALVFAPDAVLVYGGGEAHGRDTMRQMVKGLRERELAARGQDSSAPRPARARHFMTNLVIEVDGDRARVKDYWMHLYNNNAERTPVVTSYGHGENELVKIDGEWLIAYRRIYNEQSEDRWARDDNPSFVAPR
jgi:uncharacterized protein (TIGR02246 family)